MFEWYFKILMWLQVNRMFNMILEVLLIGGFFVGGLWAMRKYSRILNDVKKLPAGLQLAASKPASFYSVLSPVLMIMAFVVMLFFGFVFGTGVSNDAAVSSITHYQQSVRYDKVIVPSSKRDLHIVLLRKDNRTIELATPLKISQNIEKNCIDKFNAIFYFVLHLDIQVIYLSY